jgi:hypothetical protein
VSSPVGKPLGFALESNVRTPPFDLINCFKEMVIYGIGMNRYENGKIYKIVDVGYNKCYIGSTCESLSKRMERHRKQYKEYSKGKTRKKDNSGRYI